MTYTTSSRILHLTTMIYWKQCSTNVRIRTTDGQNKIGFANSASWISCSRICVLGGSIVGWTVWGPPRPHRQSSNPKPDKKETSFEELLVGHVWSVVALFCSLSFTGTAGIAELKPEIYIMPDDSTWLIDAESILPEIDRMFQHFCAPNVGGDWESIGNRDMILIPQLLTFSTIVNR